MKIVHFINSIDKKAGGTAAYMELMAKKLNNHFDLIIVAGKSSSPIHLPYIRVKFFNLKLISFLTIRKEFRAFIESEKPDLVHINGIWTPYNWLFQKETQKLGIKVVISPHGMLEKYILNRNPLKKSIALWLYQKNALERSDFFHATAYSEYEQIYKLGYRQSVAVIPNGVDISQIKQKTHWYNGKKRLLFLSRLHPKKGIEVFIKALSKSELDGLSVIIAGEGELDYVNSLKELAIKEGVANLIEFIGGVYESEKWKKYQEADVFVLPTYSENFGIVVTEALATGIPVITTTGTPWQELIEHNCGWWIDLNTENLSNVIKQVVKKDPEVLKAMGLRGRKLVVEKYDIKVVSENMKMLYEWILNKDFDKLEYIK